MHTRLPLIETTKRLQTLRARSVKCDLCVWVCVCVYVYVLQFYANQRFFIVIVLSEIISTLRN